MTHLSLRSVHLVLHINKAVREKKKSVILVDSLDVHVW